LKGSLRPGEGRRREKLRIRKEIDRPRGAHILETTEGRSGQNTEQKRPSEDTDQLERAEGGTSQNTERKQLSKGHSPTRDGRGKDKSGHGKKAVGQGVLTPWRRKRDRQVRARKESNEVRIEDHSRTGDGRGRDRSGHKKKATKQGALTNWRPQRDGQVRMMKESD